MQDAQLLELWQTFSQKLDESLVLNRKNAEDVTKIKVKSLVRSMQPLKVFALLVGFGWVIFVDSLLVSSFPNISLFFLISAGLQVLLTKIALGIYLYQLILIQQVDISAPVLKTQEVLAKLTMSTLWVTRILFLQLPLWTTFYLSRHLFENGITLFLLIQILVTLVFTIGAVWLFWNVKYANRNKRWFLLLFKGREWTPVLESMELLSQIESYKSVDSVADIQQ